MTSFHRITPNHETERLSLKSKIQPKAAPKFCARSTLTNNTEQQSQFPLRKTKSPRQELSTSPGEKILSASASLLHFFFFFFNNPPAVSIYKLPLSVGLSTSRATLLRPACASEKRAPRSSLHVVTRRFPSSSLSLPPRPALLRLPRLPLLCRAPPSPTIFALEACPPPGRRDGLELCCCSREGGCDQEKREEATLEWNVFRGVAGARVYSSMGDCGQSRLIFGRRGD